MRVARDTTGRTFDKIWGEKMEPKHRLKLVNQDGLSTINKVTHYEIQNQVRIINVD